MSQTVHRVWFHPNFDPDAELIYLDFLDKGVAATLAERYHATLVEDVLIEEEEEQLGRTA